jgi:N-acetylgalactosamine-N,N'-diacetylbacillosaminyl-diphospho-undecaprenol 4-alpha-N-acetylgalactosaminyltransferase
MTSRNEGFPNALVEGMAMGLAPVSTNCFTGPAEILTEYQDTYSCAKELEEIEHSRQVICSHESEMEYKTVAIYGEYGILTPAMTRDRDMDFAHFEDEHYNLAEVMIELLKNEDRLNGYKEAAKRRAQAYDYKTYRRQFMNFASAEWR